MTAVPGAIASRVTLSAAIVVTALAVTGCGKSRTDEHAAPPTVTITADGYEPSSLTVAPGTRVEFVNRDGRAPHSAKDDRRGEVAVSPQPGATKHDGSEVNRATRTGFVTHALFPGEAQTVVFPVAGRYSYHCAFAEMRGTIVVRP